MTSTEPRDDNHTPYTDTVEDLIAASGWSVADYGAEYDGDKRTAFIELTATIDPVTRLEHATVLTWDDHNGWQHGNVDVDRRENGIQDLTDLTLLDQPIDVVAHPDVVVAALRMLTHTVPDDLDDALADYDKGAE